MWRKLWAALEHRMSMTRKPDTAFAALESELMAEAAASLGRAGTRLERALAALAACDASRRELRGELLDAAGAAAYAYIVQREALGMRDSSAALDVYEVPEEVRVRMGRRVAAPPEPEPEDMVSYFTKLALAPRADHLPDPSKGRR